MRGIGMLTLCTVLALGAAPGPAGAKPGTKPADVTGTVTRVDPAKKSFVLERKAGWGKKAKTEDFTVLTTGGTTFKHVGFLPLTRKPASFTDLAVNEKVEVRGMPTQDGKVGATYVLIKHEPKK